MDPNETYRRMDKIADKSRLDFRHLTMSDMQEFLELWESLDGWMQAGGFLPQEWERRRG